MDTKIKIDAFFCHLQHIIQSNQNKTKQIMNLFILSLCYKECAECMFDKHISKIIIEAVQMLCTAKHVLEPTATNEVELYKISHKNHPVSIWIRTSLENYMWTLNLVDAMHTEWKYRYNHPEEKNHKSYEMALYLAGHAPHEDAFPQKGLTQFALAMPDIYKCDDPVDSYRNYYQSPEKKRIASWKKREPPLWYQV